MSIIYRYYKQYRYFSHITATRVGGRLDEPEVPRGGVAAGGVGVGIEAHELVHRVRVDAVLGAQRGALGAREAAHGPC